MKEQTMTASGPLLVGGTRYEENALKLLEQCSHQESKDGSNDQISKYDLAKLHILYPTMMILHEQKFKNMTPKEIKHTVDSAMQGLSQVKEEKQKEIIANLWKMLEGGQVELEVIENFEQMLERNGASLPAEVEAFKEESKKFSKDLAVKLSRKMKLSELEEEVEKSKELKIVTHKTKKLKNIVEKAQKWMQEAQATIGNQVQLTDLGRLLSEARKMNVEYDITDSLSDQDGSNHPKTDLFEELKERHTTALSLISQSKSSSTVVESRKTRSKQKRSTKKETPHLNNSSVSNSQKTNILSSKISKEEATSILDKIDELKVSSQKVDLLREHLTMISHWEQEANTLTSKPLEDIDLGELETLVDNSKAFKYVVKTVATLQDKLDLLEWKEDVRDTLDDLLKKPDEDNKDESKEEQVSPSKIKSSTSLKKANSKITLNALNSLISDGKKKGFGDCKEIMELNRIVENVNIYKTKVLNIFEVADSDQSQDDSDNISVAVHSILSSKRSHTGSNIKSKHESVRNQSDAHWNRKSYYANIDIVKGTPISIVQDLIKEGEQLNLALYVVEVLKNEIDLIEEWTNDSKHIVDTNKNTDFDFSTVEELYETSKKFKITSEEITKIQQAIKPIISWSKDVTKFINSQTSHLKSKNKKKLDAASLKRLNEVTSKSGKDSKIPMNPYETLFKLIKFFKETPAEEVKMEVDDNTPLKKIKVDLVHLPDDHDMQKEASSPVIGVNTPEKVSQSIIEESKTDEKLVEHHEIDDLLNEKGELKQMSPQFTDVKEDKELNEKLDILMRDCRGRNRKSKATPKKILAKLEKIEKVVEADKNELSPPNVYWLKFERIDNLYSQTLEYMKVTKDWMEKCYQAFKSYNEDIMTSESSKYLSASLESIEETNIDLKVSELSQLLNKNEKTNVPVVYDPKIIKKIQTAIDKLNWIKKLNNFNQKAKSQADKPAFIKFKKLEFLDKEGKKIFKKLEDKNQQIYTLFSANFTETSKWMEKLDELRNTESENDKMSDKEDDLWTMPELELLIEMGKDLYFTPTEYNDINKIHKVAYDWKVKVDSLLNEGGTKEKQIDHSFQDLSPFETSQIHFDDVIKLIEETKSDKFEVEMPEIALLQNLYNLAKVWQKKAHKILNSKSLYLQNYNYEPVRETYEKIIKSQVERWVKKREHKSQQKHQESISENARSRISEIDEEVDVKSSRSEKRKLKRQKVYDNTEDECNEMEKPPVSQSSSEFSVKVSNILENCGVFDYKDVF